MIKGITCEGKGCNRNGKWCTQRIEYTILIIADEIYTSSSFSKIAGFIPI